MRKRMTNYCARSLRQMGLTEAESAAVMRRHRATAHKGHRPIRVRALGPDTAEILIYDVIGFELTAKDFAQQVKDLGDVSEINVRINSPGGDVFDGMTIYNILRSHPARIIVDVDGMAASIASVIAMAGDEIRMAKSSMMMIHSAWGVVVGDAEDMATMAAVLVKLDGQIADVYAQRSRNSSQRMLEIMAAETFLTADEAVAAGLADSVTNQETVSDRMGAEAVAVRMRKLDLDQHNAIAARMDKLAVDRRRYASTRDIKGSPRTHASFHEAGHVVALIDRGVVPGNAWIDDDGRGAVHFAPESRNRLSKRAMLAVTLSGPVAESSFRGCGVSQAMAKSDTAALQRDMTWRFGECGDVRLQPAYRDALSDAERIVSGRWGTIVVLAENLRLYGQLNTKYLRAIASRDRRVSA